MKTTALIVSAFLGISALAVAQEQDGQKADRQPPVVTEQQVVKHAEMAQQERKKAEAERKFKPVKPEQEKQKEKSVTSSSNNTSSTKKSSKKPGEQ
jgi:hypothetical protein